jgi:hypothetical protein
MLRSIILCSSLASITEIVVSANEICRKRIFKFLLGSTKTSYSPLRLVKTVDRELIT